MKLREADRINRAIGARMSVRRLLAAVGGGYFLLGQLLLSLNRVVSWDEAVYLSQVTGGVPTMPFVASRARGITMLVWPVAQAGVSLPLTRLMLSVVSAIGLPAAYGAWIHLIGMRAALAAVVFGSTWLALLYGSEVMPNLASALLAVATIGVAVRSFDGGEVRGRDLLAPGLLAALGLFRPPDAVPVLIALLALGVGTKQRPMSRVLLVAGLCLGWLPWVIEMSVRFGGPIEAIRQANDAAHVGTSSIGSRIVHHLATTNGPILSPGGTPYIPIGGVLWWAGLVILTVVGLVRARRTSLFRPMLAATVAAGGLAAEYLFLVEGVAPRFLLPTYALLAIPISMAVASLYRDVRHRLIRYLLVAFVAVPWFVWQLGTADRIEAQTDETRIPLARVGQVIRERSGDGCRFASTDAFPQIAYSARCDGGPLTPGARADLEVFALEGGSAFIITDDRRPPTPPSTTMELVAEIPRARGEHWFVYQLLRDEGG